MKNPVIQIAVTSGDANAWPCIYALRADGSVLRMIDRDGELGKWMKLPAIPDDSEIETIEAAK